MISPKGTCVIIRDTTLREGLDTPRVAFSAEEKYRIVQALLEAAVPEIEMVAPSCVFDDLEMVKRVKDEGLGIRTSGLIYAYGPGCEEEVEAASKCLDRLDLLMPVSFERKPYERDEKRRRLFHLLEMATDLQGDVGVGFPHSTQTELDFLAEISQESVKCGASRVTLYDTNGCADPFQVYELIRALRKKIDGKIFFHGHNDLGLAVANSLSAVKGGADGLDTTINGLGDRAGNASFEQVVMALHLRNIHTQVKLSQVVMLSKIVEEISGVLVSKLAPVIGEYAFCHKSPSHLEKPDLFEAFDPETIRRYRELSEPE
jgi:isopropylmalate/homocitrate/citramalate synthase